MKNFVQKIKIRLLYKLLEETELRYLAMFEVIGDRDIKMVEVSNCENVDLSNSIIYKSTITGNSHVAMEKVVVKSSTIIANNVFNRNKIEPIETSAKNIDYKNYH